MRVFVHVYHNSDPYQCFVGLTVFCGIFPTFKQEYCQSHKILLWMVRDDPKLLDDGGQIPNSQGRG
jgi:hypothetical protein